MVHRGIKFSCRFTVNEIQSRWYALLYSAEISRVAVAAMKNLHPDLVAAVRSKALFSNGEEELLSPIASVSFKLIYLYRIHALCFNVYVFSEFESSYRKFPRVARSESDDILSY